MNYFSTRDKSLKFSFKDIFLRGLAPGGGLFLPKEIKKFNKDELNDLRKLDYKQLATEIIYNFCKEKDYSVEVLVNNAGYGIPSQFHKTSMEDEEKSIRVLSTSVIALSKAFIPDMLEKLQTLRMSLRLRLKEKKKRC